MVCVWACVCAVCVCARVCVHVCGHVCVCSMCVCVCTVTVVCTENVFMCYLPFRVNDSECVGIHGYYCDSCPFYPLS